MNANKCEKSAKVGKSAFCNHYRKDWIKQKLSIEAKSRGEFWQGARCMHGLKLCPHRLLINGKEEKIATIGGEINNTLNILAK